MVKKGRHRRYEEARAVKHASAPLQLDDLGFVPEPEPIVIEDEEEVRPERAAWYDVEEAEVEEA